MKYKDVLILLLLVLVIALVGKPHLELLLRERTKREGTFASIHERRSVRTYTDERVPSETLSKLVEAGMAAPSAADRRPWAFVIVTQRETLDALGDLLTYGTMLRKAPAAIALCGLPELGIEDNVENAYWIQDVSAASQNVLLAAEAMGLGAVWVGIYPVDDRVEKVRQQLGLPDEVVPFSIIPVGFPLGQHRPKDKYDERRIHWEHWRK